MSASSSLDLDNESSRNDETRNNEDFGDGDFPALKLNCDRREHAHHSFRRVSMLQALFTNFSKMHVKFYMHCSMTAAWKFPQKKLDVNFKTLCKFLLSLFAKKYSSKKINWIFILVVIQNFPCRRCNLTCKQKVGVLVMIYSFHRLFNMTSTNFHSGWFSFIL